VIGRARAPGALGLLLVLAGCSTGGVDVASGTFHSAKGYRVAVPATGWTVDPDAAADLQLTRTATTGAMLVDASCAGRLRDRSLAVLARHLTFGLRDRHTVESDTWTVDGRPAAHQVIRGRRDGMEVTVEAVVLKGERCVHDFLYVARPGEFEEGRRDFRVLVESFAGDR
jgi:hypothetical protein